MLQTRLLQLLMYLLRNKKTTLSNIAQEFQVSIRTVQRDIDRLSVSGVPITTKQGTDGGVFIDESYKISKSFLNDNELKNMVYALNILDSISTNSNILNTINKLTSISPDLASILMETMKEYFKVDLFTEKIDTTSETIKNINYCFDEEKVLRVHINNEIKEICPISYVLKSDGLYLYAYSNEYILINIKSIKDSTIIEKEFIRDFIPYELNKEKLS